MKKTFAISALTCYTSKAQVQSGAFQKLKAGRLPATVPYVTVSITS